MGQQQARSGKQRDESPHRKTYKAENRLMKHKVRNLMKYNKKHKGQVMTKQLAMQVWEQTRKRSRS